MKYWTREEIDLIIPIGGLDIRWEWLDEDWVAVSLSSLSIYTLYHRNCSSSMPGAWGASRLLTGNGLCQCKLPVQVEFMFKLLG